MIDLASANENASAWRGAARCTAALVSVPLALLLPPAAHENDHPATAPAAAFGVPATTAEHARRDYAEGMVREFLVLHFAGSREFSATGMEKKTRYLTPRFRSAIYKFLTARARSRSESSSPPMVSDPFTGSMRATDYSIGKARVRSEKASVPVTFTDGTNRWTVTYLLRNDQERGDDRWRLDDIEDVRGMLLSRILREYKP
jgi:hypothetical protein